MVRTVVHTRQTIARPALPLRSLIVSGCAAALICAGSFFPALG
ncbi:hypothetical protein [Aurantiacibacter poecillastricola]|nr:hypothetical protein [Aurantiacibacter sp. 219JJ12-13]MDP5260680.1 hypothetical protein [Aurantiacibacter sp. 219JJ12-13]